MNQKQNDFDQWVRQLADEAESPFHETSWIKMEELLDKKEKKRGIWWLWPLGLLSFLLLSGIGYFILVNNGKNAGLESSLDLTLDYSDLNQGPIHATVKKLFEETNSDLLNSSGITTDNTSNKNDLTFASIMDDKNKTLSSNQDFSKSNNVSTIDTKIVKTKSNFNPDNYSNLNTKKTASTVTKRNNVKRVSSINSPEIPITETNKNSEINKDIENESAIASEVIKNEYVTANTLYTENMLLEVSDRKLPNSHSPDNLKKQGLREVSSAIIVSIHGSPEITTVPDRSYGRVKSEFGFGISYQFTPHLSITSGLQKTIKTYNALGEDYEAQPHEYLYNKIIHNIAANCTVIEWPITVGYKFNVFKNNFIQLNAGLASMRMDKEIYDYEYSYYKGGKVNKKQFGFDFKNWEMWSTAIVNCSYTKPITKHLSFSLTPYLKMPIKGVGEGNIDLKSIGGQIGVNYQIPTSFK